MSPFEPSSHAIGAEEDFGRREVPGSADTSAARVPRSQRRRARAFHRRLIAPFNCAHRIAVRCRILPQRRPGRPRPRMRMRVHISPQAGRVRQPNYPRDLHDTMLDFVLTSRYGGLCLPSANSVNIKRVNRHAPELHIRLAVGVALTFSQLPCDARRRAPCPRSPARPSPRARHRSPPAPPHDRRRQPPLRAVPSRTPRP